jgi:hypothetical protein
LAYCRSWVQFPVPQRKKSVSLWKISNLYEIKQHIKNLHVPNTQVHHLPTHSQCPLIPPLFPLKKKKNQAGCWWLIPVILAIQKAEIRRIMVQSQPRQIVLETLSQKKAGGVAQDVGPEFKP